MDFTAEGYLSEEKVTGDHCSPPGQTHTHTWTDEETEEEKTRDVPVSLTEGKLSPQSDVFSDWEDVCVEVGEEVPMESSGKEPRMLKLRRNLHQLDRLYAQKELNVLKASEELSVCCLHISELQGEREALEELIDREKQEENSVGVFRLRAQHKHVCEELHREEELQALMSMALREHELELCKVEVQMAHVCELCEELKQEEQEKQHRKQDRHLLQEKTSSRAHRRTIQQGKE
ncbi:uncharacterized protein LOC105902215 [Clupea harengus]|uniref:Uncharacterized protein LOC105902215 n=1 Tax=Clupea harengus TaxID=7950 RepID=A0A6P8FHK4_CLUHA|nr:uncharacterized protein LOC105902215 [Clupea harengus]